MMKKCPPFSLIILRLLLAALILLSFSCSKKEESMSSDDVTSGTEKAPNGDSEKSPSSNSENILPVPDVRRGVNTQQFFSGISG